MAQTKKRRKLNLCSLRCSTVRTVYRVQDREGRGPWRPGFSKQWVEDRPESEYAALKPIIVEFPGLFSKLRSGFYFGVGCTSIEKLRRWITASEWKTLQGFGFECFAITPDRIVEESEIQCVFESKKPLRKHKKRVRLHP